VNGVGNFHEASASPAPPSSSGLRSDTGKNTMNLHDHASADFYIIR
jgi:hypothetical protein